MTNPKYRFFFENLDYIYYCGHVKKGSSSDTIDKIYINKYDCILNKIKYNLKHCFSENKYMIPNKYKNKNYYISYILNRDYYYLDNVPDEYYSYRFLYHCLKNRIMCIDGAFYEINRLKLEITKLEIEKIMYGINNK